MIVSGAVKRKIITRLSDFESPKVFTYSVESTIAERFDAILQRMAETSQMKDFFDIYYLSGMFDFEGNVLREALSSTLRHRNRELLPDVFTDIDDFKTNKFLLTQWKAFTPAKETELIFADVINRLELFLEPLYQSMLQEVEFDKRWSSEKKQWI